MNILFLAREIPYPADSGVKMRAWLVLKHLAQRHKVTMICYAEEAQLGSPHLQQACESVHAIKPLAKVGPISLYVRMLFGLFSAEPFAIKRRYSKEYNDQVKKVLQEKNIDLIVCDSLYQAVYVPEKKYKTLLNEHNIESVIIERYAELEKNSLKAWYARYELKRMKQFEEKIWNSVELILVCSDIDKAQVQGRCSLAKIEIVANGVDLPALTAEEEEPFRLTYTGLIGWHPNEDAVMYFAKEMYPLIKQAMPQVCWWIVGKGPSAAVKQLANEGSITVTGAVERIEPYIKRSAVIVVPLRIGSGTRLKILEALAMKKAVVSTSIGCEGLEVEHKKNILIADTYQDFANAVIGLLNDPQKRKSLGESGRRLVEEKYSYEVIGKEIGKIIEKL